MLLWFKNLVGVTLSEEQMQDIPTPSIELYTHVTIKTVQAFGLIGTTVVGPLAAVAKADTRSLAGLRSKVTSCGRGGLILGLVAGPLLTYAKVRNITDEYAIWDRCYRLRYNRGQVRVDRASIGLAIGGAGVGYGMAGSAMFGGLIGMSAGIILAAFYNSSAEKMVRPVPTKQLEDKSE